MSPLSCRSAWFLIVLNNILLLSLFRDVNIFIFSNGSSAPTSALSRDAHVFVVWFDFNYLYIIYSLLCDAFLWASFQLVYAIGLPYVVTVDDRVSNDLRWFHFPCQIPVIVRDGFRMHCMPTLHCFFSPCSAEHVMSYVSCYSCLHTFFALN